MAKIPRSQHQATREVNGEEKFLVLGAWFFVEEEEGGFDGPRASARPRAPSHSLVGAF